jgi:hypothetical protein
VNPSRAIFTFPEHWLAIHSGDSACPQRVPSLSTDSHNVIVAMALSIVDILIVVFSLILTFAVALWKSYTQKNDHSTDFFLSGKSVHWFLVGASLFASNIGTEHFIGQAGSAAASGMLVILVSSVSAHVQG